VNEARDLAPPARLVTAVVACHLAGIRGAALWWSAGRRLAPLEVEDRDGQVQIYIAARRSFTVAGGGYA
jgi:hypothetical protein